MYSPKRSHAGERKQNHFFFANVFLSWWIVNWCNVIIMKQMCGNFSRASQHEDGSEKSWVHFFFLHKRAGACWWMHIMPTSNGPRRTKIESFLMVAKTSAQPVDIIQLNAWLEMIKQTAGADNCSLSPRSVTLESMHDYLYIFFCLFVCCVQSQSKPFHLILCHFASFKICHIDFCAES